MRAHCSLKLHGRGLGLLAVLLLAVAISPAQAQYLENTLHIFTLGDGQNPNGPLIFDSKGNLYGTTFFGGDSSGSNPLCSTAGCGVIFELSPPSGGSGPWTETVLYTFHGSDGQFPNSGLILDAHGNLYGSTENGPGRVFELSPPSGGSGPWTLTALRIFLGGSGGGLPGAVIMDAQGNLYGATSFGGGTTGPNPSCGTSTNGCGVVYQLSPPSGGSGAWTETVLYAFTGGSDGGFPGKLIFDAQGNLYGTTATGGGGDPANCSSNGGCGVVFRLSPPSGGNGPWTETVLYTFSGGSDGAAPVSLVFDSKGNLFGTTATGGEASPACANFLPPGCGVVYELSPPSSGSGPWTETVLHTFTNGSDGALPDTNLIFDSKGNLYSTTFVGGASYGSPGVAFELSPPSSGSGPWTETVLYTFTGGKDGAEPQGVTIDSAGNLYGADLRRGDVAFCGGLGCGTVFELSPAPPGTVAATAPVFSPPQGFTVPGTVLTISSPTPGAAIYYSTNNAPANTDSTLYTGPITLTAPVTFEAIAAAPGYYTSAEVVSSYAVYPQAPIPTFLPAPGTYTSAQMVTISDSAPQTEILYAINATPNLNSPRYTGPITVNSTETISAIAVGVAGGYTPSPVASATYTITPPPDFQVSVNPNALTIVRGQTGKATFTVTPENGFISPVSFACSGLPLEATCSFSPPSVTPNGAAISSTLTITTTPASAAWRMPISPSPLPSYALLFLALAMIFGIALLRGRAQGALQFSGLLILLVVALGLTSCGGSTGGTTIVQHDPGTPLGPAVVSVSASANVAGPINHAANLTITITP